MFISSAREYSLYRADELLLIRHGAPARRGSGGDGTGRGETGVVGGSGGGQLLGQSEFDRAQEFQQGQPAHDENSVCLPLAGCIQADPRFRREFHTPCPMGSPMGRFALGNPSGGYPVGSPKGRFRVKIPTGYLMGNSMGRFSVAGAMGFEGMRHGTCHGMSIISWDSMSYPTRSHRTSFAEQRDIVPLDVPCKRRTTRLTLPHPPQGESSTTLRRAAVIEMKPY